MYLNPVSISAFKELTLRLNFNEITQMHLAETFFRRQFHHTVMIHKILPDHAGPWTLIMNISCFYRWEEISLHGALLWLESAVTHFDLTAARTQYG